MKRSAFRIEITGTRPVMTSREVHCESDSQDETRDRQNANGRGKPGQTQCEFFSARDPD
jgi:hypothetical protein